MKKALSLLLSLLMLFSLLAMPVYAGEDDGFNDGKLEWGDIVEPEEPTEGTEQNPIYVAMGMMAPTSLQLKAGESIYYQLKAQVFNGYSLIVGDTEERIAFTVDGVRYDAQNNYSYLDYGIKAVLEFTPISNGIVCFTNESDTDMEEPITVTWEMPVGTETDPLKLEDGDNAISIPVSYSTYYANYNPYGVGDYTLSASNYEDFLITVDVDGDLTTTDDVIAMTDSVVLSIDNEHTYVPFFVMIQPLGVTPDIVLTVTPPLKGTEENPYEIFSFEEMIAGLNGEDGLWPASTEGVYYRLYGFAGTTLQVYGEPALHATIGDSTKFTSGNAAVFFQLEESATYYHLLKVTADGSFKMTAIYPEGNYYNPIQLGKGNNTMYLPDSGEGIYASYTAEKDGVLILKPNTVAGLGYTEAANQTSGEMDFIAKGWVDDDGVLQGASDDNVLTIPVLKGDVVLVMACAGENDDFEIIAMNLVLNVSYEGDVTVKITKEPATANYAKEGAKLSVKITASGEGLKYAWYIKNDGATKYTKSSITSATYTATMGDKVHNRRIYCVVTDKYGNTVQSKTFMLRRQATITKEPATVAYAKKNAKVSVKITAKGDGLKYTWYIKNDGASKYSKSSITSATYTATMGSKVKGRKVYCVVTDKYGKTVQSKTFLLRESVSIITQPKTVTVAKNKTAKITVKASGDGLKYTWYVKNAGATKYTKSSVTKSTYSVKMTAKVKNRLVYCVVTDKYGKTVKTVTVKLKMK